MKKILDLISKLPEDWQTEAKNVIRNESQSELIRQMVEIVIQLPGLLEKSKTASSNRAAVAEAMKLGSSSEKSCKGRKRGKKSGDELLNYLDERAKYYRNRLRTARERARKREQSLANKKSKKKEPEPVPDIVDTDKEFTRDDAVKLTEQVNEALSKDAKDGDSYGNTKTDIINSPAVPPTNKKILIRVRKGKQYKGFRREWKKTTRYNLSINVIKVECHREVLTDPLGGKHVAAKMGSVGPKGSRFTWQAIASIIILLAGAAIPMFRLERLLGKSPFRRPNMVRIFTKFAWKYLPVYLDDLETLAQAKILSGDDTPTRVNEVTWWKNTQARARIKNPEALIPKPWETRAAKWKTKNIPSLYLFLKEKMGFEFKYAVKTKVGTEERTKVALQTTVVTGFRDELQPLSRIVIYRTHFGSFGNLLDYILSYRRKKHKEIIIQGDLSKTNNPTKPPPWLKIKVAGCLAHARRAIKRYFDQDPDTCGALIAAFGMITMYEHLLDDHGRNSANVNAMRNKLQRPIWKEILEVAKSAEKTWSSLTPLGRGFRYITKGIEKLMVYLDEPRLDPDNNFCENSLRYEALEDNSSYGRDTIEGRCRFDVIRSALATCAASQLNPNIFIIFICIAKNKSIKSNPELYTVWALKNWIDTSKVHDFAPLSPEGKALKVARRAVKICSKF